MTNYRFHYQKFTDMPELDEFIKHILDLRVYDNDGSYRLATKIISHTFRPLTNDLAGFSYECTFILEVD